MRDLYNKLIKILKLEQERSFNNSAVIGGLEGFLTFWLTEARAKASATAERRQVEEVADRLHQYGQMAPDERRSHILYLLERLGATETAPPAAPPPPAAPEPEAPAPSASEAEAPAPSASEPGEAPATEEVSESEAEPPAAAPADVPSAPPPVEDAGLPPAEALRLDRELDRPVTTLSGIGTAKAQRFKRLGIESIRELLYHAPFRYEDYTRMKQIADLVYGDEVTIAGVMQDINMYKSRRGTIVVNGIVSDGTGTVRCRWFGNQYIVSQLRPGTMVRLMGKVEAYLGKLQLNSPRYETIDEEEIRSGRLVPVYPRTEGLSEKVITRDIGRALDHVAGQIPDPLPAALRRQYGLIDLGRALRWLHQPESMDQVHAARQRLAFDELLRLQLGMLQQRREWKEQPGEAIPYQEAPLERFYGTLPFALTGAQKRAIDDILRDMGEPRAMSRMLQGDVGSGKTAVAAVALLATVSAGYQGALMAPTEILAEQHYQGLSALLNPEGMPLLADRPVNVALLTGSASSSEKEAVHEGIASGEIDVVIGTHALIQEGVDFSRLGLAIVDEQHRFGVQQRGALRSHARDTIPNLLVMSATPIPRSLALTLYGDLDLSVIDEMPPGRQPIVTRAITPRQRERAYTYIRRQITEGRQAYIICPLVEESEKLEARAAVEEHRFLQQEVFPEFKVGLLHGRLKAEEKEAEMARFYRNESQILVSTSVVEVGIDVPNATVMLIEGANRFGLAQLHQFRGRIGRGQWRSLCLLMAEEELSADGEARLNTLVENADGFALADKDLQMRGPGDFFGTRQSGLPELKMARLGDTPILARAREAGQWLLEQDSELARPEHQLLNVLTERYWERRKGDLS